ncbi:MAG TPA: hypothetical protein VJ846_06055 [Sphingomicrobium sp.]|nr:hypothetical protein [Sphingomicrobium sp.]
MQRSSSLGRYLNPWKFKREQEELQRIAELRQRDGDHCRRCRRAIRFDLSTGHDQAPKIHDLAARCEGEQPAFETLCLVHTRCNAVGANHTAEVRERVQRRNEAALFANSKRRA